MTKDEALKLMEQADRKTYKELVDEGFAIIIELIRADEREACAKVCEQFQKDYVYTADLAGAVAAIKHRMADAIRARGNT